ncbi:MAG: hypothetical protein CL398_02915 [Acidiferrobacteraceae bacterium]|nr:hypothetical protein [Acidiferrobacteraceae bacterium]|tara:strand:+ start:753 stop:1100 length:348 start_codon:yes stop_codon:yes gene_type:complete
MKSHLEAFFAAWMRHDSDEMAEFYHQDAVMEDPTLDESRVGRLAIRDYYQEMFESLEQPEHDLLDYATQNDRVWFEWTFASGGLETPRLSYHGVSIQTIPETLIVHDHAFWSPNA